MSYWGIQGVLALVILFCCTALSASSSIINGGLPEERSPRMSSHVENDGMEVVQMEGAPAGVVWVVQMSDIHISKWVPARGRALRKSLGHALKLIKPAIVLVTGDLTDAKNKDRTKTSQEEVEWIEYRDSFQKVADDSGIQLKRFYDLRGNHDKYGVPLWSSLDYHSKYSISAAMNRTSLVQSVTVEGHDGERHLFVGFDDSMHVGLRGPSNVFGHPTDDILAQLDEELRRWDNDTLHPLTKIVYGHFPMSFTTSTESGKRPEEVIADNNVAAYICGHLHTAFGRRLYKQHKLHVGDFWEWEMGDWRASRVMRIMAIDHGHTSFVDVELVSPQDTSEGIFKMPTVILQTYPLDSRFMLQSFKKGSEDPDAVSNSIRALVFSETIPASVKARIYDFSSHPPLLVSESSMKIIDEGLDKVEHGTHYYITFWDRERYMHSGGLKYAIRILAESVNGSTSYSEMRFISANGDPGEFHLTALAFLVMGFKWEIIFYVVVWGMVLLSLLLLVVSKVFLFRLEKGQQYEEWMTSVFRPSSTPSGALGKVVKVPFWAFLECSRNHFVWVGLMVYVSYLTFFPWFSGRVLADEYPIGYMSLRGWTVKVGSGHSVEKISGLGIPDIMSIAIPYVYGVLLPLLLMISALSAERAACEFHMASLRESQKKSDLLTERESEFDGNYEVDAAQSNLASSSEVAVEGSDKDDFLLQPHGESDALLGTRQEGSNGHQCNLCSRLVRKGLVVGCLGVLFIHWRLCSVILRAYGAAALVAAPAYAWGVPALLILSLYRTSMIRRKPPLSHEQ